MNVTTKMLVTVVLASCLTPVMNAAPQRGRNRPPAEAWLIEKPIGGERPADASREAGDLEDACWENNCRSRSFWMTSRMPPTIWAPSTKITTRMHPQSATVFVVMSPGALHGGRPVVVAKRVDRQHPENTLYSYEVVGTENALWVQDNVRGYGTVFPIDGPSPTPGKGNEVVKVEFSHKPGVYTKPSHLHVNTFDAIATCTVGPAVAEDRMYVVPHVNYVNPADDKCRAAAGGGGRGGDDGEGPAGAAGAAFDAKVPFGHLHSGAVEWWSFRLAASAASSKTWGNSTPSKATSSMRRRGPGIR
jgi:hypothetical protein